jgi:hypothetical protein
MKRFLINPISIFCFAAALASAPGFGQEKSEKALRHGTMTQEEMERLVRLSNALGTPDIPPPLWSYTVKSSRDNNTYTGMAIGRSPFARGLTTTNVPVVIIPLVLTVNGVTLDPTAVLPGSCSYPATWNGKRRFN